LLVFLLPAFLLCVFVVFVVFVVCTPAVFLFPLLFVTTAMFDGTLLPLVLVGIFTFVSTTAFLFGTLLLLGVLLAFVFDSPPPQPTSKTAPARTTGRVSFIRTKNPPLNSW
jgi:hypothetical protein